ncbi:replication initiation protein [Salmonella enterica]|nr:replication initiation protein [Salmonella enterica]EEJ5862837.1 replication initiation protein [Salmonella enterica]EGF5725917.1 replication initiation protein [Salmonella enterica]ELN0482432.1 replication initiation protein [Salmonella enterica]
MDSNNNLQHWSQLTAEDQIRFWQSVDQGDMSSFLVTPEKKSTRRRRGEHSTKPKCENPSWFRPAHYKALGGQLGHAYNRLVKKDPVTGRYSLRMHMSLHPFYVRERQRAGRKYAFRPEKQRLLDALWPVLVSFCDAGKHTVGMCVSRLARELSPKDAKGNAIPDTEVTVSRISNLIAEQVRFGTLGVSEETTWDRESRKRLRESEERRRLIEEGMLGENEDISVHAARKRWYLQRSQEALKYRREKGAARKRANRLAKLPRDRQIYEMSRHIMKTLPPDEAYWCSPERLEQMAIQNLYQLELSLATPPPH